MVGANFCIRMCKAAGLTASDKCIACGEHEDHLHLFKQCPFYAQTRPPDVFQCSTWCTGIFPRSQIYRDWAQEQKGLPVLPPWNVLCLYLWSSFWKWIGFCKQMAATSDCCVGFLASFSRVEGGSPGMLPNLSRTWDFCPSVLFGLFQECFYSIYRLHECLEWI